MRSNRGPSAPPMIVAYLGVPGDLILSNITFGGEVDGAKAIVFDSPQGNATCFSYDGWLPYGLWRVGVSLHLAVHN